MEAAIFVALSVGACVAMFLAMMVAFVSPDADRKHRRARARDLAMYRHLPEANLLRLND